jgi:hypothetical protein
MRCQTASIEHQSDTYEPLDVLKPLTNSLWIVDGRPIKAKG